MLHEALLFFSFTSILSVFYSKEFFSVGAAIEVQKDEHPSKEKIDDLHQTYLKELEKLFEAHKTKYGVPKDKHLHFIE